MKQYTTPQQTSKLIELGFEKPKSEVKAEQAGENSPQQVEIKLVKEE